MNTKIKVVGVGGSGGNAVSRMMSCKIKGVELIAINTDAQDLKKTKAHFKIRIGKNLTKGLGAGMNPEIGRRAAEESKKEIADILSGADMVFITCGLGGGTGSGASPVVAGIAKECGILTAAVVTMPFSFEGAQRLRIAKEGLENLKSKLDTLLVISNDKICSLVDENCSLVSAFWFCDEILRQAVEGITDLIFLPGIINVDFNNIKTIIKDSGFAFLGIGKAKGEKREERAAKSAISSPLLNLPISGARKVLFNISAGDDLKLIEVDRVAEIITESVNPEAKIVFGVIRDEKLQKGEIKVMVVATGFVP